MDDVLVFGETHLEHDQRLRSVLQCIRVAGLTLSEGKCEFSKDTIKFLGHIIDASGVRPDPDKLRAIKEMKQPSCVNELRRFHGMVNQTSKFCPQLADKTKPLRDLLSTKNQWIWEDPQDAAFQNVKDTLCSTQVLAHYDLTRETTVSADASSYGLGAVLRQKQPNGEVRPIAYISREICPN